MGSRLWRAQGRASSSTRVGSRSGWGGLVAHLALARACPRGPAGPEEAGRLRGGWALRAHSLAGDHGTSLLTLGEGQETRVTELARSQACSPQQRTEGKAPRAHKPPATRRWQAAPLPGSPGLPRGGFRGGPKEASWAEAQPLPLLGARSFASSVTNRSEINAGLCAGDWEQHRGETEEAPSPPGPGSLSSPTHSSNQRAADGSPCAA